MAVPTTMPERVKAALKHAGLSVTRLAEEWGVDRSALSTRLNAGTMEEAELARLAERTGTTAAWLRYGVVGDYEAGVRDAVAQVRRDLDRLLADAIAERGQAQTQKHPDERIGVLPKGQPKAGARKRRA